MHTLCDITISLLNLLDILFHFFIILNNKDIFKLKTLHFFLFWYIHIDVLSSVSCCASKWWPLFTSNNQDYGLFIIILTFLYLSPCAVCHRVRKVKISGQDPSSSCQQQALLVRDGQKQNILCHREVVSCCIFVCHFAKKLSIYRIQVHI